jgi:hypothetical protein
MRPTAAFVLKDKADMDELHRLNAIAHAIGDDLVHVETFVMQARPLRIAQGQRLPICSATRSAVSRTGCCRISPDS